MRLKAIKIHLAVLVLLAIPISFCNASTPATETGLPRSLKIWNSDISYRLLIQNDPHLSFDGKAFIRKVHGKKMYFVVLNTAFFEKEARALFLRFQRSLKEIPSSQIVEGDDGIMALEERLVRSQNPSLPSPGFFTPELKNALKKLQNSLEEAAWLPTYQASMKNASTPGEAERDFVKAFTRQRMKTLEYHEAAHLHDIQRADETESDDFERFTEANAFFAELAYGENPHDVMVQALTGLIDEMNRGKVVDHSVDKVVSVLRFLKQCPRFARLMNATPLPKCCLEMMVEANRGYFTYVGQELHRNHQNLFASTLP